MGYMTAVQRQIRTACSSRHSGSVNSGSTQSSSGRAKWWYGALMRWQSVYGTGRCCASVKPPTRPFWHAACGVLPWQHKRLSIWPNPTTENQNGKTS
jgi:hypothetical protein